MVEFSVIVVTYRRPTELVRCLESLGAQTLLPREVIVVDNDPQPDGSAERICSESTACDFVKYVHCRRNSLPVARNLGVSLVTTSHVGLIDDDVRITPEYFEIMMKAFESDRRLIGAQGYIRPEPRSWVRELYSRIFRLYHLEADRCRVLRSISTTYPSNLRSISPCEWISGSNQVYVRSILLENPWDETLLKYADGEDLDHSYRIYRQHPRRLAIVPQAHVEHDIGTAGRIPKLELVVMQEVYGWYLCCKLFPQSIQARLVFLWSRFGRLLLAVLKMLAGRHGGSAELAMRTRAYRFVVKHRREFARGELAVFNREFLRIDS